MKTILISFVALALLGKAQDETIGSVTTPANFVANQAKARKAELVEINLNSKQSSINPSPSLTMPKGILLNREISQFSFLKGDMAFDENIISAKEWADNSKKYLLVLSTTHANNLFIRLYQNSRNLDQYQLHTVYKDNLNCAMSNMQNLNNSFTMNTSDENSDGQLETWIKFHCNKESANSIIYLVQQSKVYALKNIEEVKNLPNYLQVYAYNLFK